MDISPTSPPSLPPEQRKPGSTGSTSAPSDWVTKPTGNPKQDFTQNVKYAVAQFEKELQAWFKKNPHCSSDELDTKSSELFVKWMHAMLDHLIDLADKGGPAYKDLYMKWKNEKSGPVAIIDFSRAANQVTQDITQRMGSIKR